MSYGSFPLEILTPERCFYEGEAQALTIATADGELTVLCGHVPITAPLAVGSIRICTDGQWREAFQSEGFLEVDRQGVHVFVQACEWQEDIDAARAERAEQRARTRLSAAHSQMEVEWTKIALSRAMCRLRLSQHRGINFH